MLYIIWGCYIAYRGFYLMNKDVMYHTLVDI
jgi:hypothetical protein